MTKPRKRVVLFGTGLGGLIGFQHLCDKYRIIGFADNDTQKHGQSFCMLPVYDPRSMSRLNVDKIIVCSMYHDEIQKQLIGVLGFPPKQIDVLPKDALNFKRKSGFLKKEKPQVTIRNKNYNKIFCIGSGKTGTTSMKKLLTQFGFKMGDQAVAELLATDWLTNKDAERIIRYCYTADAFQDAPFGYRGLYRKLDEAFPDSKFILTVRNNPDEWFESLIRFHTKMFSSDPSRAPNEEDLANANYRYRGFMLERYQQLNGKDNIPLYHEDSYKRKYEMHNEEKRIYFKERPEDFLEINLSVKNDFRRLCEFLNIETNIKGFPWENKSQ